MPYRYAVYLPMKPIALADGELRTVAMTVRWDQVQRNLNLLATGRAGLMGLALAGYLVDDTGEEVGSLDKRTHGGAGCYAEALPLALRIAGEDLSLPTRTHLTAGKVAGAIAAVLSADPK